MEQKQRPDFREYTRRWSDDLECLRQNRLQAEGAFIRVTRDRGLPVWGSVNGDPGDFHKRGWLTSDGTDYDGGPLFHPFRVYPLHQILETCQLRMARSSSLHRGGALGLVEGMLAAVPSDNEIADRAHLWNAIVDLAVLLEPVYWPDITGHGRYSHGSLKNNHGRRNEYREKVLRLVQTLDPEFWREQHSDLRFLAGGVDDNSELYLLLRVGNWRQREMLTGSIAFALWIRHMAEVIRRGFEDVRTERWPEEDQSGRRVPGARKFVYGSERPLDDLLRSTPYLAYNFGLFTGSAVQWYVEGDTEYYAIIEILLEWSKLGIELVNLTGGFAKSLGESLKEDVRLRRFSMISFDVDDESNKKMIRRQIEQENIVGSIAAHNPDFEFANFSIRELAEVAARVDERESHSAEAIRSEEWKGIKSARTFAERYRKVSKRRRELKGEKWGRALGAYALEHPRGDDGSERPLLKDVRAALHARLSNYDYQRANFTFDRATFAPVNWPKLGPGY